MESYGLKVKLCHRNSNEITQLQLPLFISIKNLIISYILSFQSKVLLTGNAYIVQILKQMIAYISNSYIHSKILLFS